MPERKISIKAIGIKKLKFLSNVRDIVIQYKLLKKYANQITIIKKEYFLTGPSFNF